MTIKPDEIISYERYARAEKDHKAMIESNPYKDSPFNIIKEMSPRNKAYALQDILAEYIFKNYKRSKISFIERRKYAKITTGSGRTYKAAIKTSFVWAGSDKMRWQQMRTNEDYDIVIFVGVEPKEIKFAYAFAKEIKLSGESNYQHSKENRLMDGTMETTHCMKSLDLLFIDSQDEAA